VKGARAVVELLERQHVEVAFGIPGGVLLPLYDELVDAKFRHILARHEQCAGHMADGYARASRKPGVCIATSGPGATNLVTGVATAFMDSSPLVAITGQVATGMLGADAFQEADSFGIMMPITKHNFRVMDPKQLPNAIKRAFSIATTGRFGPVHVDIPSDVLVSDVPDKEMEREFPISPPRRNLSHLLDSVKLLESAERPAILVGGGAAWSNAGPEILKLAEILMSPVVTTLMGKGVVPDTHPLVLGVVGMHGKQGANYALHNCDVLLGIGTRFSDRVTGKVSDFARNTKIIHVDIDASEIGKNVKGHIGLVGDAWTVTNALIAGLRSRSIKQSEWKSRIKELKAACACDFDFSGEPIKPQKVIKELSRYLPDDAIITTEVGQNQMWCAHFLEMSGTRQFITSGGLGTMGFGFPASIGAKVAKPDKTVVDVAGDGSLQMVSHEFATAVQDDIPVIVCLMNNGWLGMVKQWQKLFYEKRYKATTLGNVPDFVKLAQAYGADAIKVEKASELKDAIRRAVKSDVAFLIDVAIDPEEDALPMIPPGKKPSDIICGRCKFEFNK
jgi:acetolactate synthase-1/2/3 large subunit